jgi:diguanylate cyclase (GGDEF)-like protein
MQPDRLQRTDCSRGAIEKSVREPIREPVWRVVALDLVALLALILVANRALGLRQNSDDTVIVAGGLTVLAFVILWQRLSLRDSRRFANGLMRQIVRDPLTGLANHRLILQCLDRELVQARAHDRAVALAMIDVDDFKSINDRYGHQTGDAVLKSVADALIRSCRQTDLAARYAGDEFVLVLPGLDLPDAHAVSQRLRSEIARIRIDQTDGSDNRITVSIGIAVTRFSGFPAGNLIAIADRAMYDAKRAGKNLAMVVDADRLVTLRGPYSKRGPTHLAQADQIELTG